MFRYKSTPMIPSHRFHSLVLLVIIGITCGACEKLQRDEGDESKKSWIESVDFQTNFVVKSITRTGEGIENKYLGRAGQGMAVRDGIMYRLYNTGLCQTYDITNLAKPKKIASFELGSHVNSNHANSAQSCLDENGEVLLYVSGLNGGKTFVERITPTGSTLVQTITLSPMDILGKNVSVNSICGNDGFIWLFGTRGKGLYFAKARKPLLEEGDVTLYEDDILDYWSESDYVYNDDVLQGGSAYNGYLFVLFGRSGGVGHLAIYDTRVHQRLLDIDLSKDIREEPEDCEVISQGILVVTNGGSNYYIINFDVFSVLGERIM